MDHLDAQEVARLKELLRRTGEFIAYFELADTKMVEWRYSMEEHAKTQRAFFHQQLTTLQETLQSVQTTLTQAGLIELQQIANGWFEKEKLHLSEMKKIEQNILHYQTTHQHQIKALCEESIQFITKHTTKSLDQLQTKLAQYDVDDFHNMAITSCEQVGFTAKNAIMKSESILRRFQFKTVLVAFLTSMCVAFAVSFYISDELPWEIHQHALSERQAGRLLMLAWPNLTINERNKILKEQNGG